MSARRVWAEVRYGWALAHHAAQSFGYVVRPYDMLLDARRWRWQSRGQCGRMMPQADRDVLTAAVLAKAARQSEPTWKGCTVPPAGWWCSRGEGHDGPCAARRVSS